MDNETFEMWNAAPSQHESHAPEARDAIEQMRDRSVRCRVRQHRELITSFEASQDRDSGLCIASKLLL